MISPLEELKPEMRDYLDQLELASTIKEAMAKHLRYFKTIFPNEQIIDIFVEIYEDQTNKEYLSLYIFTNDFQITISQFVKNGEFSIYPYKKVVDYITIKKESCDFESYTGKSKIILEYSLAFVVESQITAIGRNCKHLQKIINNILIPNLYKE